MRVRHCKAELYLHTPVTEAELTRRTIARMMTNCQTVPSAVERVLAMLYVAGAAVADVEEGKCGSRGGAPGKNVPPPWQVGPSSPSLPHHPTQ